MEKQTESLKIEPVGISDIGSESECECECESVSSLNSWYSEEDKDEDLDKILRFEEKKIIYELFREGRFDYNQLKEMLQLVR